MRRINGETRSDSKGRAFESHRAYQETPLFRKKQRGFVILLPQINGYRGGRIRLV